MYVCGSLWRRVNGVECMEKVRRRGESIVGSAALGCLLYTQYTHYTHRMTDVAGEYRSETCSRMATLT